MSFQASLLRPKAHIYSQLELFVAGLTAIAVELTIWTAGRGLSERGALPLSTPAGVTRGRADPRASCGIMLSNHPSPGQTQEFFGAAFS
jgi:hypothetical protein